MIQKAVRQKDKTGAEFLPRRFEVVISIDTPLI